MNNTPRYVQNLERETVEGSPSQYRFGEVYGLSYMGAAEYEFGAFPAMLRRMNEATLSSTMVKLPNGKKVFVVYDSSNYESEKEVQTIIRNLFKDKYHLKCNTMSYAADHYDAWVDINNGLFFSYENLNNTIPTIIANSVTFMDERKAAMSKA